jgi:uncharacterized protein YjiS (DUF1127 family)
MHRLPRDRQESDFSHATADPSAIGRLIPGSGANGLVAKLAGVLSGWRRRERERRELAAMNVRDFGDVGVPPSLIGDETRRWPWQKSSPQWGSIAGDRRDDGRSSMERWVAAEITCFHHPAIAAMARATGRSAP